MQNIWGLHLLHRCGSSSSLWGSGTLTMLVQAPSLSWGDGSSCLVYQWWVPGSSLVLLSLLSHPMTWVFPSGCLVLLG